MSKWINRLQVQHKQDQLVYAKEIKPYLRDENFIKIFPFRLISGAFLTTNDGFKGLASYVNNYNDLALIFTGQESINVEWRESIDINQVIDASDKTDPSKNYVRRTKKIGRFFEGYLKEHYQAQQISIYAPNTDFQKLINARAFTIVFHRDRSVLNDDLTNNEIIDEFVNYEFDFFACPEIVKQFSTNIGRVGLNDWPTPSKNISQIQWDHQLFRPLNVSFYYNDMREIISIEVKFASVNDFMSNSGFAIQQYVNFGAPGQGYPFPIINVDNSVGLDPTVLNNFPISHCQVDINGVSAISSIVFFGYQSREGVDTDNNVYEDVFAPSEIYFTNNFQPSLYDNSKQRSLPETNFYLLPKANADLITQYQKWSDIIAAKEFNPLIRKNYEGFLYLESGKTKVLPTNPSSKTEPYKYTIFDDEWLNDSTQDGYSYTNDYSSYDGLFASNVYFQNDKDLGLSSFANYTNVGGYNIANFFMRNHCLYSNVHQIPINIVQSILISENLNISLGSIVGKFVPFGGFFSTFFNQSLPVGFRLNKNILKSKYQGFDFLMSANIFDIATGIFADNNDSYVPMDTFRYGTEDASMVLGGQNTTTTSFLSSLSNEVELYGFVNDDNTKDDDPTIWQTYWVGQSKNGKTYFYTPDSTVKPMNDPTQGFIITGFQMKSLAKTDFRLGFYSKPWTIGNEQTIEYEDMVWQGYYKTKSNLTNNVFLWETTLTLGNPFFDLQQNFEFPNNYKPRSPELFFAPDLTPFQNFIGNNIDSTLDGTNYDFTITNGRITFFNKIIQIPINQTNINPAYTFDNFQELQIDANWLIDVISLNGTFQGESPGLTNIDSTLFEKLRLNKNVIFKKSDSTKIISLYKKSGDSQINLPNVYPQPGSQPITYIGILYVNNFTINLVIAIANENLEITMEMYSERSRDDNTKVRYETNNPSASGDLTLASTFNLRSNIDSRPIKFIYTK